MQTNFIYSEDIRKIIRRYNISDIFEYIELFRYIGNTVNYPNTDIYIKALKKDIRYFGIEAILKYLNR